MTRLFLLTACLLCSVPFSATAQVQASVYMGAGYSYASATAAPASNEFNTRPSFAVLLNIPVWKNIGVETGCSYTVKGFINKDTLWDEDRDGFWAYRIGNRLSYLAFPLMFTYRFNAGNNHTFYAGAGMVYGFMIHGTTQGKFDIYLGDRLIDESEFTTPVQATLMPSSDNSNTKIYLFDTGLKLQCSYVWRGRFGIRLFHEQSLYSYHPSGASKSETRLRYTGIALSFGFPRLR
jgi:hypothetical protein